MRPYRIKHVPTGLYYKPGEVNLSKNGKAYPTGLSALSVYKVFIPVNVRKDSKIHKSTEDKIAWKPAYHSSWFVSASIPIEQFVKEEI